MLHGNRFSPSHRASLLWGRLPVLAILASIGGAAQAQQFWDGAGAVADGQVLGGIAIPADGTWDTLGTNWTTATGDANGPWANLTAIFQGTAFNPAVGGTVTIVGTQSFDTLRFLNTALPGNGPSTPGAWSAVYGKGDGSTGWLGRTSWEAGRFTIGGVWGKGDWGRETKNLALGGDITRFGAANADEYKYAVNLKAQGRDLKEDKLLAWNGNLIYDQQAKAISIGGGAQFGPRWATDRARAAIAIGPALNVVSTDGADALPLHLDIPIANVAAEYDLKEWLLLRGSTTAGWAVDAADSAKFTDTESWSSQIGGMVGLGFKRDTAQFDMSVNPGWLIGGPALLSGATAPMFATISGRVAI